MQALAVDHAANVGSESQDVDVGASPVESPDPQGLPVIGPFFPDLAIPARYD